MPRPEPVPGPVVLPALRQLLPTPDAGLSDDEPPDASLPQTRHPHCAPDTQCQGPVAAGCLPHQPLRAGRVGGTHPRKGSRGFTPQQVLGLWCLLSPSLTSQEGRVWAPRRQSCPPTSVSWISWHWAGTWAIASCPWHWSPLIPPVGPQRGRPFSPAVGSKHFLGIWDWDWWPCAPCLFTFAAVGSSWLRASHLWPLGSTALDRVSRTHSCTIPRSGPRLRAGYLV